MKKIADKIKLALCLIGGVLLLPVGFVLDLFRPKKKDKSSKASGDYVIHRREDVVEHMMPRYFKMTYVDPIDPLPDSLFVERIDEFICIQYWSRGVYMDNVYMSELIASAHPEKKAAVIEFLKRHPISDLMTCERNSEIMDSFDWQINFIFEDQRLNRRIRGYGITEGTSPYLSEMLRYVPNISQFPPI